MNPVKAVHVGGVPIGDGYPTVFMAETSTYFNQDIDLAVSFVEAASWIKQDKLVPISL